MSWPLSRLMVKLLAAFLLILDLSQEPASALPAATSADGDGGTITEIATKEDFRWPGSAPTEHELALTFRAERSSTRIDCGQVPLRLIHAIAAAKNKTAIGAFAQGGSDYKLSDSTALPPVVAAPFCAARAYIVQPHHRNTALAHRSTVVLTV